MILGKTRTFWIFFLIFILKFSVVCSTEIKKNNDINSIKSTFEESDLSFDEEKYFDNNFDWNPLFGSSKIILNK